ncbi:hypothetical protein D3C85_1409950 [compost metagenome]
MSQSLMLTPVQKISPALSSENLLVQSLEVLLKQMFLVMEELMVQLLLQQQEEHPDIPIHGPQLEEMPL